MKAMTATYRSGNEVDSVRLSCRDGVVHVAFCFLRERLATITFRQDAWPAEHPYINHHWQRQAFAVREIARQIPALSDTTVENDIDRYVRRDFLAELVRYGMDKLLTRMSTAGAVSRGVVGARRAVG